MNKIDDALVKLRALGYAEEAYAAVVELDALRAALKPFAELSSVYVRRAETFGWKDADGVFGAADITKDVTIRVADCRAALKAIGRRRRDQRCGHGPGNLRVYEDVKPIGATCAECLAEPEMAP